MVTLDLVLLLNFLVGFLLLLGTNRLTGFPLSILRTAAGALLGALHAGACLMPGFSFLGNFLWRCICLGLMGMISFGLNATLIRRTAVFIMLSMALGGIAVGTGEERPGILLLCCVALLFLCRFGFPAGVTSGRYIPVELSHGEKRVEVTALHDTGNRLKDPVTGEQVFVAGPELGWKLLGLSRKQLENPLETIVSGDVEGLRLIPYRCVGNSGGMLLACRFRQARIGSIRMDPLVAFAPEEIGREEGYQMLTGGAI